MGIVSRFGLTMTQMCLVVLVCIQIRGIGSQMSNVFMSSGEMERIFSLEQKMVEVLEEYKLHMEQSIEQIRSYVDQVSNLYSGEGCWPVSKCSNDTLLHKIVGNPIYSYQLIKRLNVDWKTMEQSIREADSKKTLAEIKRLQSKFRGLPTEADLKGAAEALNRLQRVYKLNVTEFSRGNILGLQTGAELEAKDTFYLGRFAYMNNNLEVAVRWLETAIFQAIAENGRAVKESQVSQVLKQVKRKLPPGFDAIEQAEVEDAEEQHYVYRLGNIPPKTYDPKKMMTDDDAINFSALCRGLDILPASERRHLKCFLSSRQHPYFILAPLKTEIQHGHPHKIVQFHDIISEREVRGIIEQARPKMSIASIGNTKLISEMRVSKNTWLRDGSSRIVDKVSLRINLITGLQTTLKYDKQGKTEEYEDLQVANYGIGGHYDLHHDPMVVYKEPDYLATSIETKKDHYFTGDRMTTFMFYLSEVSRGGKTAFPRLGVAVPPVYRSAVLWHNIKRSGRSDMAMLHGGCPVLVGSKWVANKWVREVANIFTRKCEHDIDH